MSEQEEPTEASEADESSWWQRVREHRAARWAIDLTIFAAIFAAISMWQTRDLVETGHAAPALTLQDMNGEVHDLADWKGEKTMLVFWAPWCGVCGAESDNVSRVQSWLGDSINVVSVVLGYESRASIEQFMEEQGVDYPVLLGDRATGQRFNISAYPTLYVIDEEGNVEHTVAGYTSTAGMLWRVLF